MRPNEVATVVLGLILWVVLSWAWWGPVAAILSVAVILWLAVGAAVFLWLHRADR